MALIIDNSLECAWNSVAVEQQDLKQLDVLLKNCTQIPKTKTSGAAEVHHWHFLLGPSLTSTLVAFRDHLSHDEFSEYFYDTEDRNLLESGWWLRLRQYRVKQGKVLLPKERVPQWTLKRILKPNHTHEVRYKQYNDEVAICRKLEKHLKVTPIPGATPMTYCDSSLCGFTTHRYRESEDSSWFVDCALIPLPDDARENLSLPFEDKCFACLTQEWRQTVSHVDEINIIEHCQNDAPSPSKAIVSLSIKAIVTTNSITRETALNLCRHDNPFGDTYVQ